MFKGTKAPLVLVVTCFVTVACNLSTSDSTGEVYDGDADNVGDRRQLAVDGPLRYLQEEVPPCTPVPGSYRDPCAMGRPPRLPSNALSVYFTEIPAYWDLYYDPAEGPSIFTPHLVIRATFLPNTTRCGVYTRVLPGFENFPLSSDARLLICFVDARVNSYLVGTGPPTLSVSVHNYFFLGGEGGEFDWLIEADRGVVAAAYEGREGVLFLAPSATTVVEGWWMTEFWDVQQTGNTLNVVAPFKEDIEYLVGSGFVPEELEREFTLEKLALLERPLSEFETIINEGAVARTTETGGRIGIGDDLPMLITDANLLRPYYEGPGVGVSYETDAPALPPPAPGDGDPVQPPITTGEEDDGSSGTVPVPGDGDLPGNGGGGTVP